MNDPEAVRTAIDSTLERLRNMTPEEAARRAQKVAELEAARRFRERINRADLRGVPGDRATRVVAISDTLPEARSANLVVEIVMAWRNEAKLAPAIVFMSGPPNTGKTCALARAVTHHARSARFIRADELPMRDMRGDDRRKLAMALTEADLLAIDELGVGDLEPDRLLALLCRRYDAGRLTLIATNVALADLERVIPQDGRLMNRLVARQRPRGLEWWFRVE